LQACFLAMKNKKYEFTYKTINNQKDNPKATLLIKNDYKKIHCTFVIPSLVGNTLDKAMPS
jgi:hypothetical protein